MLSKEIFIVFGITGFAYGIIRERQLRRYYEAVMKMYEERAVRNAWVKEQLEMAMDRTID